MARRRFIVSSLETFARSRGISRSSAGRLLRSGQVSGAQKSRGQWFVPLTTKQYAAGSGVSERTARRRGRLASDARDLSLELDLPSNLDGKGLLPLSEHRPTGNIIDPAGRPYQYQGWALARFISTGDLGVLTTERLTSSKRRTRSELRSIILREIERMYGSSSPYEILKIGVFAYRARSILAA